MFLYNFRNYISANALALAGFIFAHDWYEFLFVRLPETTANNYASNQLEGTGVMLAIFYTFMVALAILIVLSVIMLIEYRFRKFSEPNKKLKWLKNIHAAIVWLGFLLFVSPIIYIVSFMLFLHLIA